MCKYLKVIITHFMYFFGKPRIFRRCYPAYLILFHNISDFSKQWRNVWDWGREEGKLVGLALETLEKKT